MSRTTLDYTTLHRELDRHGPDYATTLAPSISELYRQLSTTVPPKTTPASLLKFNDFQGAEMHLALDAGTPIGMASVYVLSFGNRTDAILEDVVVLKSHHNRGIGMELTRRCLKHARERGAGWIQLTSARHRKPAHRMYEKFGFTLYDTYVYELHL